MKKYRIFRGICSPTKHNILKYKYYPTGRLYYIDELDKLIREVKKMNIISGDGITYMIKSVKK